MVALHRYRLLIILKQIIWESLLSTLCSDGFQPPKQFEIMHLQRKTNKKEIEKPLQSSCQKKKVTNNNSQRKLHPRRRRFA
jgi:hypothetical protein